MTYGEDARRRWGMFYAYWKQGWESRQTENSPAPPECTERARQAFEDGQREHREATTGHNWNALGILFR